jgi:hypothetical protein
MLRPPPVFWFIAAAVTVVLGSPRQATAYRFDTPQAKITWIDAAAAPRVRIYVSFLSKQLRPVPFNLINRIEVFEHEGGRGRGTVVQAFNDAIPEGEGDGEVLVFAAAEEPRDTVLVLPGHQGPALLSGELGIVQRSSIDLFFNKLGPADRLNVIWYYDRLLTYVNRTGKTNELSDLANSIPFCLGERLKAYEYWGKEPPPPEDPEASADPPCGLLSDYGKLQRMLRALPYRGFYPRLLGFDAINPCIPPAHPRMDRSGPTGEETARETYGGAIDEALKMLVTDGAPARPKRLIILSDGRDGYLDAQEDCRLRYVHEAENRVTQLLDSCRELGSPRAVRECQAQARISERGTQMRGDYEKLLQDRLTADQQRFRDQRLGQWLALARAANIQIFAIGYPDGMAHERERLEVLAMRSGGTYREIEDPNALAIFVSDLLDEFANQYIIEFDADLKPLEERSFSVRLGIPGLGSMSTAPLSVIVPELPGGAVFFAQSKLLWLEDKVGSPWHIVILVVAGIIALFFVYAFIKLIIGLFKKLFGKATKAAKGAGKAGKGMGMAAVKARR